MLKVTGALRTSLAFWVTSSCTSSVNLAEQNPPRSLEQDLVSESHSLGVGSIRTQEKLCPLSRWKHVHKNTKGDI